MARTSLKRMEDSGKLFTLSIRCYHCGKVRLMSVTSMELYEFGMTPSPDKLSYYRVSRVPCEACVSGGQHKRIREVFV